MLRIIKTVCLLLLVFTSFSVSAKDISRKEVLNYISVMDKAIKIKNAEIIGSSLSDSVSILESVSENGINQTKMMNKVEYLRYLKSMWSMSSNNQFHHNNDQIILSGDKAVITTDISESMIFGGRYVSLNATESVTLKRIDGRIFAISIVINGSM